jgi:hypothetical protein
VYLFSELPYGLSGPIQWVSRFFPEVKRLGPDIEHSTVSSAEVKNKWRFTSAPLIYLIYLPTYLSTYLSVCLSICMSVRPSFGPFVYVGLSI